MGGSQGSRRLYAHSTSRQVSKEDVANARRSADETGRIGEELVNAHLNRRAASGDLQSSEWTAEMNAVAPYDFRIVHPTGEIVLIDVKSTAGEFERPLHFSFNEILQIANGAPRYEVYRVFGASITSAKLRICSDTRPMGKVIFDALSLLPDGVTPDSLSVRVDLLPFGPEILIEDCEEEEL